MRSIEANLELHIAHYFVGCAVSSKSCLVSLYCKDQTYYSLGDGFLTDEETEILRRFEAQRT